MKSMADIDRRTNAGIERLKEDYELKELDVGDLEEIPVHGDIYKVKQYEIVGVGNLLVMKSSMPGEMQMDTFTLTPYFKNLPLFTTDYMYIGEKRMFLYKTFDLNYNTCTFFINYPYILLFHRKDNLPHLF